MTRSRVPRAPQEILNRRPFLAPLHILPDPALFVEPEVEVIGIFCVNDAMVLEYSSPKIPGDLVIYDDIVLLRGEQHPIVYRNPIRTIAQDQADIDIGLRLRVTHDARTKEQDTPDRGKEIPEAVQDLIPSESTHASTSPTNFCIDGINRCIAAYAAWSLIPSYSWTR